MQPLFVYKWQSYKKDAKFINWCSLRNEANMVKSIISSVSVKGW